MFISREPDDKFCCEACKQEWLDQRARQNARAGKGKRKNQFSDEWKAIIHIMAKHNVQYPEAVKIYESEKNK